TDKLRDLKKELGQVKHQIEEETKRVRAISTGNLKDIDRSTKEGMIEAQLLIKGVVKGIIIDSAKRRCRVTLHNGKVIGLPISKTPPEELTSALTSMFEGTERGLLSLDEVEL
ncbi:recombinase family protein, partial [Escherichia coli]